MHSCQKLIFGVFPFAFLLPFLLNTNWQQIGFYQHSNRHTLLSSFNVSVKFDLFIEREGGCHFVENTTVWPNLEIFLPVAPNYDHINELRDIFLPSYVLFWPLKRSNTSLLIVTDEEARGNAHVVRMWKVVKEKLANLSTFQFRYNSMPPTYAGVPGHDRQQWLMFWPENFTQANYIGFMDTDAFFVARVTLNDLFDVATMRPIIRALYGMPNNRAGGWTQTPARTLYAIGKKSPVLCMTYFPVIIKVAHLAEMREHLRLHLKMATFDDAFRDIVKAAYSQFDIMCAYLWYFKRDDYVWAVGQRDPSWTGPVPFGQVANIVEAGVKRDELERHGPRIAVHRTPNHNDVIKLGVCYSMLPNNPLLPSYCEGITGNRTQTICYDQWLFEAYFLDLNNASFLLEKHRQRLELTDTCPHEWSEKFIPK